MIRDYVYLGCIAWHGKDLVVVCDRGKTSATCIVLPAGDKIEVPYDELLACNHSVNINSYNKSIRSLNSRKDAGQTIFSKNANKEYAFQDGSKVWFTSDTHFGHANILNFCDRGTKDIEQMNEILIQKWNSKIGPDDTVFHLGDFSFGSAPDWIKVLDRLNGHIHLIIGNHDVKNISSLLYDRFESICFQKQITVEGRQLYLNHYPFHTWGGIYRKPESRVWQVYGHLHSNPRGIGADQWRYEDSLPWQYDVGTDNNGLEPINFHDVKRIIEEREANADPQLLRRFDRTIHDKKEDEAGCLTMALRRLPAPFLMALLAPCSLVELAGREILAIVRPHKRFFNFDNDGNLHTYIGDLWSSYIRWAKI